MEANVLKPGHQLPRNQPQATMLASALCEADSADTRLALHMGAQAKAPNPRQEPGDYFSPSALVHYWLAIPALAAYSCLYITAHEPAQNQHTLPANVRTLGHLAAVLCGD